MPRVITDKEIETYLHNLTEKEELEGHLRHAQVLKQITDRFAELAKKEQ